MHDLGKIPMSSQFSDVYKQILDIVHNQACDICLVEKQMLGLTHCDVGQMIVEKWDLGDEMTTAFTHHHHTRVHGENGEQVGQVIEMADIYAHLTQTATDETTGQPFSITASPELDRLNRETGVSLKTLAAFNDTIFVEIDSAKAFLNL